MSAASDRKRLLALAKQRGIDVKRGESTESIDKKISAEFTRDWDAIWEWNHGKGEAK